MYIKRENKRKRIIKCPKRCSLLFFPKKRTRNNQKLSYISKKNN